MSIYEAFVYEWSNHQNGMKYVGFHKGRPDDGYVCSSKYMIEEYRANPKNFQRKIIAFGTADEMIKKT